MSWEHAQRLLDAAPGLRLVFDTGNPPLSPDFRMPFPHPPQKSYEMWEHLKTHVAHIHIKDSRRDPQTGRDLYTFPGEGEGDVKRILKDILDGGYPGSFSIEPHMAVVFHDDSVEAAPQIRFENFVDYGKRTEALIRSLGWNVTGGKIQQPHSVAEMKIL
jgi:sugar phosphate isomerase/epimerase